MTLETIVDKNFNNHNQGWFSLPTALYDLGEVFPTTKFILDILEFFI